ncbi:hypothetical protein BWD14_13180 [Leptospira santarosai]|uniref:Uncharacterized protein n=1 Tax=Leptospira santarosai TaxID=28183 RepID=A0AB73LM06_9LEPT|nr:hypothetical protein BWD14_13180 [Leptospira santarosai]
MGTPTPGNSYIGDWNKGADGTDFKGHRIHLRKRIFILESGKKFIIEFCRTVDEISEKVKEDL